MLPVGTEIVFAVRDTVWRWRVGGGCLTWRIAPQPWTALLKRVRMANDRLSV